MTIVAQKAKVSRYEKQALKRQKEEAQERILKRAKEEKQDKEVSDIKHYEDMQDDTLKDEMDILAAIEAEQEEIEE